jgi:PAS domain S-box-containing protein
MDAQREGVGPRHLQRYRRRLGLLVLILVLVAVGVVVTANLSLYRVALHQQRQRLVEIAESQARLIESLARMTRENESPEDAEEVTIRQIADAHRRFTGLGATGELTLARSEGESIVFLLSRRHLKTSTPSPVALDGELAEPMRRALQGRSGTVVGLDYRGQEVVAAHEPVAELGLGIVAKIDLEEVKAPYFRAGLLVTGCALLLVLGGTGFITKIYRPVVAHLEESETMYRSVYSAAPLAFVIWDRDCRIIDWNQQAERLFGWSFAEVRGRSFFELIIPDSSRVLVEQVVEALLSGALPTQVVNENITKDGRIILCEWNNAIRYDSAGKIIGAISLGLDISKRHQAEQELARLNDQLAEKARELEQIVYVASHDLRSPLVNVQGYCKELEHSINELVRQPGEDEARRVVDGDIADALHFIRQGAARMDVLLSGLLKISRLGRAALSIKKVDMNRVMAEVIGAIEYQIKESGATVEVAELPACRADPTHVSQVFSNLLDNALKYLDANRAGRIRVTGVLEEEMAVYAVEDNGVGIAEDHQEHIFEIFHRLDPEHGSGEGLGLTIVQRLLARLGGRVEVESTPGKGSCFSVYLPV